MRILILIEDYMPGGHNNMIINLLNNWPTNDELILVTNKDNLGLYFFHDRLRNSVKIIEHNFNYDHRIKKNKLLSLLPTLNKATVFILKYPILIIQIFIFLKYLKLFKPDKVIISNGGYPGGQTCRAVAIGSLFKHKWGKPYFIFHSLMVKPNILTTPIEYVIDSIIEKNIEKFITVSIAAKSSVINRPGLRRTKKIEVIYNGIESPIILHENKKLIKELKIDENEFLIATIANFEKGKGHYFLLNVFHEVCNIIANVRLLLIGYGEIHAVNSLKKFVIEIGLKEKVNFLGFRNDISDILTNIDLVIVPSQQFESFNLVCVEAMAHKIPVIATNVGGIPEIVKNNETGLICDRSDIKGFSENIVALLKDDRKRIEFGKAGNRRFLLNFQSILMCQKYYSLINNSK